MNYLICMTKRNIMAEPASPSMMTLYTSPFSITTRARLYTRSRWSGLELAPGRVPRHPAPSGGHASGDSFSVHTATPAEDRPEGSRVRPGLGHGRDARAPGDVARVEGGNEPPVAKSVPRQILDETH